MVYGKAYRHTKATDSILFLFRQVYMSNKFLLYTQITSLKFDHVIFQVISGGKG